MDVNESRISCGVGELVGLTTYMDVLHGIDRTGYLIAEFYEEWIELRKEERIPFFMFSDTVQRGHGRRVAAYIKAHKLGEVTRSGPKRNPNSGHMIEVWVWSVDWGTVERHVEKLRNEEED